MNTQLFGSITLVTALLSAVAYGGEDVFQPELFPEVQSVASAFQACDNGDCRTGDCNDSACGQSRESCHQPFSVDRPPRSFPTCADSILTWRRNRSCNGCDDCPDCFLPAHSIREARWYGGADFVPLTRDPQRKVQFARRGISINNSDFLLGSQDLDYAFDAGGSFWAGRRIGERLALEGLYLGSYSWSDTAVVRNNEFNILGGTGNMFSPFSGFGVPPALGLDFNNFARIDSTASLENAEINLRYRPEMVCGPLDVSFVYGVRYIHVDETLRYHTASSLPATLGAVNIVNTATNNEMIGGQIGLSSHFLLTGRCWLDFDMKGGLFTNAARQNTVYDNVDNNGIASRFLTGGSRNDSAFAGDLKLISNYQLGGNWTVRLGYQVTWVAGVATAVDNFQRSIDTLRLGPGDIRTGDTVAYHGPVLGIMWAR